MSKKQAHGRHGLLIVAFLACGGIRGQPQLPQTKTFTSATAGYVAQYPDTWYVLERSLSTLYIVNFPPSQRVRAVTLPSGGASIAVVPPPQGTANAEQWAKRDLKPGMVLVSKTNNQLKSSDSDAPIEVTEMQLTRGLHGPDLYNVDCYFTVGGHLFAGRLTYWSGDSKAQEYLETLRHVIRSLRVSSESGGVRGDGGAPKGPAGRH